MTFSIRTLSIPVLRAECHYAEGRVYLNVMLSVIMLSVIMLNVVILNVIILSVVAPKKLFQHAQLPLITISKAMFALVKFRGITPATAKCDSNMTAM